MIIVGNLLRFFKSATNSEKVGVANRTNHQKNNPITELNCLIKQSLIKISLASWEEQAELRANLLAGYLLHFSEAELLDTFSEIYLDEGSDKECKKQTALCLNTVLHKLDNKELHGYISDEANHSLARKWAVHELIERKDTTANLAFIYRVIVDNDDTDVRKAAAFALGELGGEAILQPLENVQADDPIYEEVQEAIEKINQKLGRK